MSLREGIVLLNNLDELDILPAPVCVEELFDDPEAIELDPLDPEWDIDDTADRISTHDAEYEAFWAGAAYYQDALIDGVDRLLKSGKLSEEHRVVLGVTKAVAAMVRQKLARPTHRTTFVDRVQNGALHLVKKAPSFDSKYDTTPLTYFRRYLEQNIRAYEQGLHAEIDQGGIIHIPNGKITYYRIRNLHEALSAKFGRQMDIEEVRDISDLTEAEVQAYRDCHMEFVSFEAALAAGEIDETDRDQTHDPHERLMARQSIVRVAAAVECLRDSDHLDFRDTNILRRHVIAGFDPEPYYAIADDYGMTHEGIRKVEIRALRRLGAIPNILEVIQLGNEPDAEAARELRAS